METNRCARRNALIAGALAAALYAGTAVAADAERGTKVFRACAACHTIEPGEHMTGPSLAGLWNRKAGTAPGFQRYSEALKRSDAVWNQVTLDKWLANPQDFLPGNSMTFAGIRNRAAREDVIAYLKAVSDNKSQKSAEARSARLDLRSAPGEGQVMSIVYCGDTYSLATGDGKTQKIWEFNLRFKTDSSKLGPPPGRPVVIGAGMQGDRASVVFSSPAEISGFIKQDCK